MILGKVEERSTILLGNRKLYDGLQNSPRILINGDKLTWREVFGANDVLCPQFCLTQQFLADAGLKFSDMTLKGVRNIEIAG